MRRRAALAAALTVVVLASAVTGYGAAPVAAAGAAQGASASDPAGGQPVGVTDVRRPGGPAGPTTAGARTGVGTGGTLAATSSGPSNFEIIDAYNDGTGKLVVALQANTTATVNGFRIYYGDTSSTALVWDPQDGTSGIAEGSYGDGTTYSSSTGIAKDTSHAKVWFTLNGSVAPYTTGQKTVYVTAGNTDWSSADSANRSAVTLNFHRLSAGDVDGNPLGGTPFLAYDAGTNSSLGMGFTAGTGTFVEHCDGVVDGQECVVPGTTTRASPFVEGKHRRTGQPSRAMYSGAAMQGSVEVDVFNLPKSNSSGKAALAVGSTTTVTTDTPRAPAFLSSRPLPSGSGMRMQSLKVTERDTGTVVHRWDSSTSMESPPPFLSPATQYEFVATLSDGSTTRTIRRVYTPPTAGPRGLSLLAPASSLDRSPVTGQVVDDGASPVSHAVVVATRKRSGGESSFSTTVVNSTVTDGNGKFTMQLPETDSLSGGEGGGTNEVRYTLLVLSNETSADGTPIYYPTSDNNGGSGFIVGEQKTVLPPVRMQKGGRVEVSVQPESGSQLSVSGGLTELSQTTDVTGRTTRPDISSTYSTFALGGTPPSSATVTLMAPTTGPDSDVSYATWGTGSGGGGGGPLVSKVCLDGVSVSQGSTTDSTCSFKSAGYLNLTVDAYDSIVQRSGARTEAIDWGFFYENVLVVRDASTGEVVTYLGPKGGQQFMASYDFNTDSVAVPLPAGDYTVEVRPAGEFAGTTDVYNRTAVTVTAGAETDVAVERGASFPIEPAPGLFNRSLALTGSNTVGVEVYDPATGSRLRDAALNVTGHLVYENGTVASGGIEFAEHQRPSGVWTFRNTTFVPSDLGVGAGVYDLRITASHRDGRTTYNASETFRVRVSDLVVSMDLSDRTVGAGEDVLATLRAYETSGGTTGAVADGDLTVRVYDENGQLVSKTTQASAISDGSGSTSVSLPNEDGFYRVSAAVTSGGGEEGIAERWVRVSSLDLSIRTNETTYRPSGDVGVTVTATDAATGDALSGASVQVRVNGEVASATTNAEGRAELTLPPATFAREGAWEGPVYVRATVSTETASGVVRGETGASFDVRALDALVEPRRDSFGKNKEVVLDVLVPPTVEVGSVSATSVDGQAPASSSVEQVETGFYRVSLGSSYDAGEHTATVTVTTASGASEAFETGFRVSTVRLDAATDEYRYDTGESIDVSVSVRDMNGEPVQKSVTATLAVAGSEGSETDSASTTTDANGEATLSLSPSKSGFHVVTVTVGEQTRRIGVQVTDVDLTFRDGTGSGASPVERYTLEPGSTGSVYVSAASGGSSVGSGADVTLYLTTGDVVTELASATTDANGDATLRFDVPEGVPAGTYGLTAEVNVPGGNTGSNATVARVSGGQSLDLGVEADRRVYAAGDTATFSASVTYEKNGTGVAGERVTFAIRNDTGSERTLGTATTGADGTASLDQHIGSGMADGAYTLTASLPGRIGPDGEAVTAHGGFAVSDLTVEATPNESSYTPGDTVALNLTANDSATGTTATNVEGQVTVVGPDGSVTERSFWATSAPYTVEIGLDDSAATGSYTVNARVTRNGSQSLGRASTVLTVRSGTETLSLSTPSDVTAGETATIEVGGSLDATGTLAVYSPGAEAVAYENGSVDVAAGSTTGVDVTFDSAGVYVVDWGVEGVGNETAVVEVAPAADTDPVVYTGPDLASNATSFGTSETIYVKTNVENATAHVVGNGTSYTVNLNRQDGNTYYGTLAQQRAADTYLVRLDTANATMVNETVVEVTG